jgi:magnesium transporter
MTEPSRRTGLVRIGSEVRELDVDKYGEIDRIRAAPGAFVWLDILSPDDDDLALLTTEFDVHPLAIEDLNNRGQRAKVDTYENQHVVVAYEALLGSERASSPSELAEMHLIAGRDYLVTVRWAASPAIEEVRDRVRRRGDAVGTSVGGLLYEVLDGIVDGYFPLIDELSDATESLESELLAGSTEAAALRRLLDLKRRSLELRRVAAPLRDVANALLRRDLPLVDDDALPYYNDLYDHLVRVIDSLDLLRDLVAATLDASLAAANNNLNAVMKRLTAFTVVLMLPTLIAGIYGMNFDVMPELSWTAGYPFALALMAIAMAAAVTYFRRRGWF